MLQNSCGRPRRSAVDRDEPAIRMCSGHRTGPSICGSAARPGRRRRFTVGASRSECSQALQSPSGGPRLAAPRQTAPTEPHCPLHGQAVVAATVNKGAARGICTWRGLVLCSGPDGHERMIGGCCWGRPSPCKWRVQGVT